MKRDIRILLVDDHQIVLDGLRALIDDAEGFECVATANNGKAAIELLKLFKVDIVLMDINMPVMDGMEATMRIKRSMPEIKILSLTQHNERAMVQKLMDCGSDGYVLKNIDRDELLFAIRKVMNDQKYFSEEVSQKLADKEMMIATDGTQTHLTDREREILRFIAEGLSSKQIGDLLIISSRTVDTHRTNLMKKLDIHNVAGLIRYALQNGISG